MTSEAGLAQTTGAIDSKSAPDQTPAKQTSPQGKCMPIGITAAGDVVFPFECKEFLEQYKAGLEKSAPAAGAADTPNRGTEGRAPEAAPASPKTATPTAKGAADSPNDGTAAVKNSPAAPKAKAVGKQREGQGKIADSDDEDKRATPRRDATASMHKNDKGTPVCMQFHSYDPKSGTYRGYDGEVHSCPR